MRWTSPLSKLVGLLSSRNLRYDTSIKGEHGIGEISRRDGENSEPTMIPLIDITVHEGPMGSSWYDNYKQQFGRLHL